MDALTVIGSLASLGAIRAYVMEAAAAAGLDKKTAYRLSLAVDEIATNSVVHGYLEANRQGELSISADIDATSLKITLEDTGAPFDPHQIPPPDSLGTPLEQRGIGGLGVYLALKGVDQYIYEYAGDRNRNILIMNVAVPAGREKG